MKKAYEFKGEKSNKFWVIDYGEKSIMVNYGKAGTNGKYEIKEFDTEDECTKQAEKLIAQKIKKGYVENSNFDYINHLYFDDEEVNLHRKTSHPNFASHFMDDFYYDCGDEEAPFGSDEGWDTLYLLSTVFRKNSNYNVDKFPKELIEREWKMKYIPCDNLDENKIKELLKEDECNLLQSDMITYSSAFGSIKITGKISDELKERAIASMKRMQIVTKLLGYDFSSTQEKMIEDLTSFKRKE